MSHLLRIESGRDRDGAPEGFDSIELCTGDLVALVGPTGSGKSRLLADIEWLSEGDSPSGRRVTLASDDPEAHDPSAPHRRVAQLSQSMQFTLDLEVGPFLSLHAKARGILDARSVVARTIEAACTLCGEAFGPATHLSSLSGGQSRALMIADTALLAAAPVVLIDEVENAGVDRRRALDLLVAHDKIVLMATHDPLLALLAPRRLVFGRGGIRSLRERSLDEIRLLVEIEAADARQTLLRERLRSGQDAALDPSLDGTTGKGRRMKIVFWEKPGCMGNARQRALLATMGIDIETRSLPDHPWTRQELEPFLSEHPVGDWFNRAARRVKDGDVDPDSLDAASAMEILLSDPILVRRPLLEIDGEKKLGFDLDWIERRIGPLPATSRVQRVRGEDLETCPGEATGIRCGTIRD